MKLNKAVEGVVLAAQAPGGSEITSIGVPDRVSSAQDGAHVAGGSSDCVEIQKGGDGYLQGAVYAPSVVSSVIDVGVSDKGDLSSYRSTWLVGTCGVDRVCPAKPCECCDAFSIQMIRHWSRDVFLQT
eukprot:scaffold169608_cov59-Cyclotella_meneghiniana.AAC.1